MKAFIKFVGTITFWCAWPLFYVYLRRSQRTRIVLVNDAGEVLVMKQWIAPNTWTLPGGGIHKGEPVVRAALRELAEETGVQLPATQLRHVGQGRYRHYGHRFPFQVFVARVPDTRGIRLQWYEVATARWLRPEQLTAHNASPDTLFSVEIARSNSGLLQ